MPDIIYAIQWWLIFFIIGVIFLPLTERIFSNFFDKGYIFAKIIGIAVISYFVFILGFLKILPFETQNIFLIIGIFTLINIFVYKKNKLLSDTKFRSVLPIFILEEFMFLAILILWSFIHAHAPDIHGLEKYMDFGFINSILRAKYFPPLDMWFTPYSINYYYFGHLITAVLTKLSNIPSSITFNLMLSAITALSFVSAFSIGINLLFKLNAALRLPSGREHHTLYTIGGGLLSALLLSFAGNLHTIYLFFRPYGSGNPVPFWNLIFSPQTFPNNYWYPNATRFIENTIHEFPIYSSVVSDLHGHFLDVPFVLLTIAILLSLFLRSKLKIVNWKLEIPLISFLLAVMYMTNAWDGIIYFILTVFVIFYIILKPNRFAESRRENLKFKMKRWIIHLIILGVGFVIFALPFSLNFKPFASGIGILCAPDFLVRLEKFGFFTFEANHCQHSPLWQLFILYGFFYFWVVSFFVFLKLNAKRYTLNASDIFILILIILSTILIVIPEFIYVKDIYPAHYRANTMFKLVYQSFIMLSLCSGYIIVRLFLNLKSLIINRYFKLGYLFIGSIGLFLVMVYPYFAINSYFGNLRSYQGLDGIKYLKSSYPTDYEAILWINRNIKGQPVILEAQGDSYTDFGRVSTNTGLPTVLGWTVHEWLWRGTYDTPAPRIPEIAKMYESPDLRETKALLKKYNVSLVFIGDLERQKYLNLNEDKFKSLGKIIYQKNKTEILEVNIK